MIPIAVVGMDCRFPGATDIDELWRLLMDGAVAKSVVPAARWDIDRFHSSQLRPGTMNTRYAHFIDDADQFDHEFFGISRLKRPRSTRSSAWSSNPSGVLWKTPPSTRAHSPELTRVCSSA